MNAVFLYDARWPFQRIGWLRNATGVTYSREHLGYGRFQFDLPLTDVQSIDPGSLIGIKSTYGLPDFAGTVDRVESSHGDPYTTVVGREWAGILADRTTPQSKTYRSGTSCSIHRDIVRTVSSRNPTGIVAMSGGVGPPIDAPFAPSADSAIDAINEVSELTGSEWQMRYTLDVKASAAFFCAERVGEDARATVHLAGKQIIAADYLTDVINDRAVVQMVGSVGGFTDRPSAAVSEGPVALNDIATVKQVQPRNPQRATIQRRGIFTSREVSITDAALPTGLAVQRKAREELTALLAGAESLSITVSPNAPWKKLMPGNIITVRLPRIRFQRDVVKPFRILGIQPREERGVMELVGKVMANA